MGGERFGVKLEGRGKGLERRWRKGYNGMRESGNKLRERGEGE